MMLASANMESKSRDHASYLYDCQVPPNRGLQPTRFARRTALRAAAEPPGRWAEDLNESSDDRPRRHADSYWPRMGALPSMEASPDDRRKCLRRGAVFGKLKGLAGSTAIVRATIS